VEKSLNRKSHAADQLKFTFGRLWDSLNSIRPTTGLYACKIAEI